MIIENELTSFRCCRPLVMLLIVFFTFSPQVSRAQLLTSAERDWLAEKGAIIFVSQSDYPPFEFVDKDHNRTGMCIDLVRWIATEYGFKVKFYDMPFHEAQEAVLSGKADIITSLFYSQEREKKFDFTSITWEVPALIFVKSERPDIIGLKDLVGKRIAMQRCDYAEEFLRSKGIEFKLLPTASFAQAVDAVVAGQADAVIGDQQVVLYHLFTHNLTKQIKSVGTPLYDGQNCMGVRAGATQLQALLCKGIQLARERGIFSSINRKWVGTSYQQNPSYKRYFYYILISILGIITLLLTVLAWNVVLRRTVARKTKFLEQSESHLRTLLKTIPDMIWVKDPNGIYLSCNARFEQFFGVLESEIVGKTDYDFVDKDPADSFRKYDQAAIAAGKACLNEEEVVYADGHKEFLETIKTPMYDQSGRLVGVLRIARDVTKRKDQETKRRESEEKYRSISRLFRLMSDNIPDLVWAKDMERKFLFVNKAQCEKILIAQDTDEPIGKDDMFFANRQRALHPGRNDWHTFGELCVNSDDVIMKSKKPERFDEFGYVNGEFLCLDVYKAPIIDENGKIIGTVGHGRIVTKEKVQEKLLKESEAQFAAAQKIAGLGHWKFDNVSASLHWSKQVYRIFELSNEYPLSLESFLARVHSDDRELVASSFMDHLKNNKPFDIQHRIVTDNSGEKWVREVCHTEYDDRGSALVTLGTVHDITTQYQQFDFYRSIWDSLPHSIYIVSQDYEIQFINKAMTKNFGPVNGRKCYEYLFHRTSVCTCCKNAQVFAGEVVHWDFYSEKDDKYFDLFDMPVTNPDGTISKLEIAIDVTKLKKDEIEAQAANQAKSAFLSNMSHELRTPLNAIIGYAQLFAQDLSLTASQQRGIRTIHQSGEHLLLLINDILDLSKFDANKMELVSTRIRLPEFFQNVVEIINIRARKKGVDFFYEPEAGLPVVVEVDELRLRQVLLNLLSNAVKFTQQGFCRLVVKSKPVEKNRVGLEIVVEDSGVGIVPEQAEQVFEPFYQAGKPLQFIEGSGLGLTISRKLVELMGGELQLESPIDLQPAIGCGPGSRISFTIEVPILEADPTLYKIPPHIVSCTFTATKKSPPKIMIVDDNPSNREVLRDTLIQFGFITREVVDGSEVLAACRNFQPDVIMMDLRMPELDGFAATKLLKRESGFAEIPVVAITASTSDMESLKRKCLENGFCDFIVKPWSVAVLLETLAELLHIRLQYSFDESISDKLHGIIVPPSQILENLQKQVVSGDINGLEKSSSEILEMDSGKYRIFAQHIASLVEDCQLIEIGKFITAYEES